MNDPQCTIIRLNVLSKVTYMNDLSQAVNFIGSAIGMTSKSTSTAALQVSELIALNLTIMVMVMEEENKNRGWGGGRGWAVTKDKPEDVTLKITLH
jgi:hypothetical protein